MLPGRRMSPILCPFEKNHLDFFTVYDGLGREVLPVQDAKGNYAYRTPDGSFQPITGGR
jgi:hypothetical protein